MHWKAWQRCAPSAAFPPRPFTAASSILLPPHVLKSLAVQCWNVELFLGGDREVRGAELPMLSKTFSYSSNNRAFMEMANLGFRSYFPPTTLLPPALSCPAENPPLLLSPGGRGAGLCGRGPQARLTGLPVVWVEHIWAVEESWGKAGAKRASPSFPATLRV